MPKIVSVTPNTRLIFILLFYPQKCKKTASICKQEIWLCYDKETGCYGWALIPLMRDSGGLYDWNDHKQASPPFGKKSTRLNLPIHYAQSFWP